MELKDDLAALASTCRILPRSGDFSALYVNLTGLEGHPHLGAAGTLIARGDSAGAWQSLISLVASSPEAALVGGAVALQAGETGGAIAALEGLLCGPTLDGPLVDGAVVLAFSDEGMVAFDVNSLAGIGLLVYAYARVGRGEDAVNLASRAHAVVGAEGFLVLKLLLLRDAERWDDLLEAAEGANPDDNARFEIDLLRARALEETGRLAEAVRIYSDLADIEAELPWMVEARRRRERLSARADLEIGADDDDPRVTGTRALPYDPLAPHADSPIRDDGPVPRGSPPAFLPTSRLWTARLSLGAPFDGEVSVRPFGGTHSHMPPATWLQLLEDERVKGMNGVRSCIATSSFRADLE